MTNNVEAQYYSQVPADFPSSVLLSSVSGAADKVVATLYDGKYYQPGSSPAERYKRWHQCCELSVIFVRKCLTNEHGKYAHLNQSQILDQYLVRLVAEGYGTTLEMAWVIRRVASQLGWPVPEISREEVVRGIAHCDKLPDSITIKKMICDLEALSSVQGFATGDYRSRR